MAVEILDDPDHPDAKLVSDLAQYIHGGIKPLDISPWLKTNALSLLALEYLIACPCNICKADFLRLQIEQLAEAIDEIEKEEPDKDCAQFVEGKGWDYYRAKNKQ